MLAPKRKRKSCTNCALICATDSGPVLQALGAFKWTPASIFRRPLAAMQASICRRTLAAMRAPTVRDLSSAWMEARSARAYWCVRARACSRAQLRST
jgi:hypothetical protein